MSANITNVNAAGWESDVLKSTQPVLADFWAEWCGPCRAIAPILEELAGEMAGKLKIVKVNVDEAPELAQRYNVRSIPTLLVLKGGQVAGQMVGAMPKAALKSKVEALLAS